MGQVLCYDKLYYPRSDGLFQCHMSHTSMLFFNLLGGFSASMLERCMEIMMSMVFYIVKCVSSWR